MCFTRLTGMILGFALAFPAYGFPPHDETSVKSVRYLGIIPDFPERDSQFKVAATHPGSPADKAGFQVGDQVVQINSQNIKNSFEFTGALAKLDTKSPAKVLVKRNGEEVTLSVIATAMPPHQDWIGKTPPKYEFSRSAGTQFVRIHAGRFVMGETQKNIREFGGHAWKYQHEGPQHDVIITRPFYFGRYEITQKEWRRIMGTAPWIGISHTIDGGDYPAVRISWDDAAEFCRRLSKSENRTYRLPTEAEWEYACRAATKTRYSFGDKNAQCLEYGWCRENSWQIKGQDHAHEVGLKKPNPWGLFDIHGNVLEWCQDYYEKGFYHRSPLVDPCNNSDVSKQRVIRGGAFYFYSFRGRSADRHHIPPGDLHDSVGLRVVLEDPYFDSTSGLQIVEAVYGNDKTEAPCVEQVKKMVSQEKEVAITPIGLNLPPQEPAENYALRIRYRFQKSNGELKIASGKQINLYDAIITKHFNERDKLNRAKIADDANPTHRQIEIVKAVLGFGSKSVECGKRVAEIVAEPSARTQISVRGLKLSYRGALSFPDLYVEYQWKGKTGKLRLLKNRTLNIYDEIVRHSNGDLTNDIGNARRQMNGMAGPSTDAPGNSLVQQSKASIQDDSQTLFQLPGKFELVKTGASGTKLIFLIREKSILLIFDVLKNENVKEIPIVGEIVFAANNKHLIIVRNSAHTAERWNLETLERELVENMAPDFSPQFAAMGNAGDGPLMLWSDEVQLWNSKTLKQIQLFGNLLNAGSDFSRYRPKITVSADGHHFCQWYTGFSGQHYLVIKINPFGITFNKTDETHSYGGHWAMPNADGSQVLRYRGGFYEHDLKPIPIDQFKDGVVLPTQSPNYFLHLEGDKKSSSASICSAADFQVIQKFADIPDVMSPIRDTDRGHTNLEPRVRFLPQHDRLICLPCNQSEVVVRKVSLEESISKNDLFVVSKPSPIVKLNSKYEYQLNSLSSSEVKYRLLVGPDDATVSPDGLVAWTPTDQSDGDIVRFQIEATNQDAVTRQFEFQLTIDAGFIPKEVDMLGGRIKNGLMAKYAVPEFKIPFSSKFSQVAAANAGRFLIFHVPQNDKLSIIDVKDRKIVHEIPVSDRTVFAGNLKHLLVADPHKKSLERYDLKTFEMDQSVRMEGTFPFLAAMGASGNGPLALWTDGEIQLWDVDNMTIRPKQGELLECDSQHEFGINVSADGKTFCGYSRGGKPYFEVMRVGKQWTSIIKSESTHSFREPWILPTPKGEKFFRFGPGSYDIRLEPVRVPTSFKDHAIYPTFDSRFAIAVTDKKVQFRNSKQFSEAVICGTSNLAILKKIDFLEPLLADRDLTTQGRFGFKPRICFFHEFQTLVYFPDSNDKVIFRDVKIDVPPSTSAPRYVDISSVPGQVATVGTTFDYQLEAIAHNQNVKYRLADGPKGMTISATGKVRWPIKKRPIGGSVSIEILAEVDGVSDTQKFDLKIQRNLAHANDPNGLGFAKVDSMRLKIPGPIKFRTIGLARKQLLLVGDKLAILKPDGWSVIKVVTLKNEYVRILERKEYYVAVSEDSKSIDLLDKDRFEVIRSQKINNGKITDLAIHPSLPLSYIAYKRESVVPRNRFVVFDESTMTSIQDKQWIGNWIAMDPSGQFLIAGFADSYRRGSRIMINQNDWHIVPKYGNLAWLIRYRLNRAGRPMFDEVRAEVGGIGNGIRMSQDGKRVAYLSHSGFPRNTKNLGGFDPIDFSASPTIYPTAGLAWCTELDFHPTLPLVVAPSGNEAFFCHRDTGRLESDRINIDPAELDGVETPLPYFAPDGKHLIVNGSIDGDRYLHKVPLSLSESEIVKNQSGLKRLAELPIVRAVPKIALSDLVAFRGTNLNKMSTAEIARSYKNSVVVTQSRNASGSGFVVSSNGYIITCEHCLPDINSIKVTYETSSGETKTVDAEFIMDDPTADLALIKITTKDELQPVLLGFGVDTAIGEPVSVIGNPSVGSTILNHTMTTGIISSPRRMIEGTEFIQSNAAINPGSSGGPMFDDRGQVIGIVVLKAKIEGAGFAIPAKTIADFLLSNIKTKDHSIEIVRSWNLSTEKEPIVAKFISYRNPKLTLERVSDNKRIIVESKQLSRPDQKFVKLLEDRIAKKNSE